MGRRKFKQYEVENLSIDGTVSDGHAVGRNETRVIFVKYAVPGDIVHAKVVRKKKKLHYAEIQQIHQASPHRTEPVCTHFGHCGGCKWQMMTYDAQLQYKQQQVVDAFQRIGKVPVETLIPILPSPKQYFYRNKLEFSFSDKRWLTDEEIKDTDTTYEQRTLGFHVQGNFEKVLHINQCLLQKEVINNIRNAIYQIALQHNISFHNARSHQGFLRNLMFRTSEHTEELMLTLIVNDDEPDTINLIFSILEKQFPSITNFLWIHNPKFNDMYSDLPFRLWKGKEYITERLDKFDFQISPTSFFQTNPEQAGRMYALVKAWAKELIPPTQTKHQVIYDLYAGTGSIGIYLSELADHIVGIEYVESSIQDAWKNVHLNKLSHFSFYAGDMKLVLDDALTTKEGSPNLIIADPPRAGMDKQVIQQILKLNAPHIIYVSCNPATQARDIALLAEQYTVTKMQAVDMFPQTAHVENVALLTRK